MTYRSSVGITTTIDPSEARAGCVEHLLRLADWDDIPTVTGAEISSTRREIATLLEVESCSAKPLQGVQVAIITGLDVSSLSKAAIRNFAVGVGQSFLG